MAKCENVDAIFQVACQKLDVLDGGFHRHFNDEDGTIVSWSDEDDPDPLRGTEVLHPSPYWPGGFSLPRQ